jgi:hypothetical protein
VGRSNTITGAAIQREECVSCKGRDFQPVSHFFTSGLRGQPCRAWSTSNCKRPEPRYETYSTSSDRRYCSNGWEILVVECVVATITGLLGTLPSPNKANQQSSLRGSHSTNPEGYHSSHPRQHPLQQYTKRCSPSHLKGQSTRPYQYGEPLASTL